MITEAEQPQTRLELGWVTYALGGHRVSNPSIILNNSVGSADQTQYSEVALLFYI